MLKKYGIFAVALAISTLVSLSLLTARFIDQEEIDRVNHELVLLKNEKIDLEERVKELDSAQADLMTEIDQKNTEIAANKQKIAKLERDREENQLNVRQLNTEDALEASFAKAYPQVINAKHFGIVHKAIDDEGLLTMPYFVIPAWFTETFVIEHNNLEAYLKEIEEYKANEELYGNVIDLKEQVLALQTEKTTAYQDGYEEAFEKYEALNKEYIALLKQPPSVEVKAPSLWPMLGGALIGITLGVGL